MMTYPIEDEVADDHQINCGLTAQDWQHVSWHPLPEVDQEILNLKSEGERRRERVSCSYYLNRVEVNYLPR